MRIVNSNPDKFVIECIEINLYDILHKAIHNSWDPFKAKNEVSMLLEKYHDAGEIKDPPPGCPVWSIDVGSHASSGYTVTYIDVEVYLPRKTRIFCKMP